MIITVITKTSFIIRTKGDGKILKNKISKFIVTKDNDDTRFIQKNMKLSNRLHLRTYKKNISKHTLTNDVHTQFYSAR